MAIEHGRSSRGWLALAVLASVLALGAVIDAVWRWAHSDLLGLVSLPAALLFWYWIVVGAWRRARGTLPA